MIHSVSSVSFGNQAAAANSKKDIQDLINQPGKFTKADEAPAAAKKKGGVMSKIGKVILGAAVVVAGMVAANKFGFKPQVLDETAGFFKKGLNAVAKGCEWVTKHTWDAAANLFKGKKELDDIVEEVVDGVAGAAE